MIFLPGGPSHQDIFDLKMDAPSEIRGEFRPIPTNVPGIQICEHLPQAREADGQDRDHPLDRRRDRRSRRGAMFDRPHARAISRRAAGRAWARCLSKLQGPVDPAMPPFVGLVAEDGAHGMGG